MNKVILMGRLTRDPDLRYAQSGTAIASISLAVNRRYKQEGQPEADFFNCSAFGKTAEFCEKYLKKGTKVVIEGEMQNNNYTDKNGNEVRSFRVFVQSIEFAESKSNGNNASGDPSDDFVNVPEVTDENLPF